MDGQRARSVGVPGRAVGTLVCLVATVLAACANSSQPAASSEPALNQPIAPPGDAATQGESATPGTPSGAGWYTYDATPAAAPSAAPTVTPVVPAAPAPRFGDEIVVAGRYIRTGTPVVLWTDPGGYAAPSTHYGTRYVRAAGDKPTADPALMGGRELSAADAARIQAEGWRFDDLTQVVDQFVLHYDVCGVSSECFRILRLRGLSVHFMLDIDGTIYQTCDVQERAYHATTSNDRSVGIEIANIGAYEAAPGGVDAVPPTLVKWYTRGPDGRTVITLPAWMGDGKVRTPGFVGSPAQPEAVTDAIHNQTLVQYNYTPEQYAALARLTSTLCDTFPRLRRDYPRDASGRVNHRALTEEELAAFSGVLGHWHVQQNKIDPGPALDWDRVIGR